MREEKWKSRLDRDPKQFIVLVATDAMRLAMLKPTKNFPPSVVIAWLSTVAATKPSVAEYFTMPATRTSLREQSDG
jgi:hypothetical protein